jgi:hypothetical protein
MTQIWKRLLVRDIYQSHSGIGEEKKSENRSPRDYDLFLLGGQGTGWVKGLFLSRNRNEGWWPDQNSEVDDCFFRPPLRKQAAQESFIISKSVLLSYYNTKYKIFSDPF